MPAGAKRDRTARLLRVEHLLHQNPHGLKPSDIARLCQVSARTAYRDLAALQSELQLPVWQDDEGRYGIERGYFLPPVKLTLLEATALFIAARLTCKYSDERDPAIESAFAKLATVLPPPIAQHVQETLAAVACKPKNETFARVLDVLATAWAQRRRVRIWYSHGTAAGERATSERLLDPYFLEPSAVGHACYVIGLDHRSAEVRTFKVERIRDIELTAEEFALQEGWNADAYLRSSWGIFHEGEVEVRVLFSSAVSSRVKEAIWHPSQILVDQPDGRLLFTARVAGTVEIAPWLLSWGAEAQVLAPAELRARFVEVARQLAETYSFATSTNLDEPEKPPDVVTA